MNLIIIVIHGMTEDDARVTLLVHQVKPPFLDGRVSFSDVREAVPTVKDSSSDFAKMAREGSATLRHLRENKVRLIIFIMLSPLMYSGY